MKNIVTILTDKTLNVADTAPGINGTIMCIAIAACAVLVAAAIAIYIYSRK